MDENEVILEEKEEKELKKKSKIPYIILVIIIAIIFYKFGDNNNRNNIPSTPNPPSTPAVEEPKQFKPTAEETKFIIDITLYADRIAQGYGQLSRDIDRSASDATILDDCYQIKEDAQRLADLSMPNSHYVTSTLHTNITQAGSITVDGIEYIIDGLNQGDNNLLQSGMNKLREAGDYLDTARNELEEIKTYIDNNK